MSDETRKGRRAGMLSDIVGSLLKRPVTEMYPFERREAPQHLRGKLVWKPEGCTGCGLCTKDCPSNAIELITIDKKAKRFVLRYHVDRCTFCAQCAQNCRFNCIEMQNDQWELAALNRQPFEVYYGNEADLQEFMAKIGKAEAVKA